MECPIVKIEPMDSPISEFKPMTASEELISAIAARPALWDKKHVHRRHRKIVCKLWLEVQQLFPSITVTQLKKKFKNLKDQYRKELRKVIVSQSGEAPPYTSTWSHYDQMYFLQEQLIDVVSKNDSNLQSEDNFNMDDQSKDSITEENTDELRNACSTSPASSINSFRVMKRSHSDLSNEFRETGEKKAKSQVNDSDDFHFLMSLLPHMERLTNIQKFKVRNKINQLMIEEIEKSN